MELQINNVLYNVLHNPQLLLEKLVDFKCHCVSLRSLTCVTHLPVALLQGDYFSLISQMQKGLGKND